MQRSCWVGLGTPRQDLVICRTRRPRRRACWSASAQPSTSSPATRLRHPRALHRTGFEWAYRLGQEPRRLWRRYLIGNTIFIGAALRQLPSARRASPAPSWTGSDALCGPATSALPRVTVGGADVHCIDERTALDTHCGGRDRRDPPWLSSHRTSSTSLCSRSDPAAGLLPTSGPRPGRRVARGAGRAAALWTRLQRITGADLFPALCVAQHVSLRIGIVGGLAGAAEEAATTLKALPGLQVVRTPSRPGVRG